MLSTCAFKVSHQRKQGPAAASISLAKLPLSSINTSHSRAMYMLGDVTGDVNVVQQLQSRLNAGQTPSLRHRMALTDPGSVMS